MRARWLLASLCLLLNTAAAEPYRPASDGDVLEKLATPGPERRALRTLRSRVAAEPERAELALDLARRYIQLGRRDSDPRFFGHAEAVLAPWLKGPAPLSEALILRATVLQNRHDFRPALADLEAALRIDPRQPQAWLSRSAIQEVQGDYGAALASCLALGKLENSLPAAVCLYSALSLSGQAESAYERLSTLVGAADPNSEEAVWARTVLAELAERLGQPDHAERWYRAALATGIRSTYLLAAYTDFLLDRNRPEDAYRLLKDELRADPLLLRLVLAEQRLKYPDGPVHSSALQARFAAAQARGDATHRGDEARFVLFVRNDAESALKLAIANWEVQKEPRDACILVEAAQAAGRPDAAEPVREFLVRTRLQDVRLEKRLAPHARRAS